MNIYAVAINQPETLATAMAYFSRSPNSMQQTLREVNADRAGKFIEKYYIGYGHASIADMGAFAVVMEEVPQLFAWEAWQHPLVCGQERSTRYQPFHRQNGGSCYLLPAEVSAAGPAAIALFESGMDLLFQDYAYFAERCEQTLRQQRPRPANMDERQYNSTIKARAFDVARYWLCWAVNTSLGQVMSIRTFEDQARRLLASPYEDVRQVAREMIVAVTERAPFTVEESEETSKPLAQTLARYLKADQSLSIFSERAARSAANLGRMLPIRQERGVKLARLSEQPTLDLWLALAMFEQSHYSLSDLLMKIGKLTYNSKEAIFGHWVRGHGQHDKAPHILATDRQWIFELTMDGGAMRDMNRHRNCARIHQALTVECGYSVPPLIDEMRARTRWCSDMQRVAEKVNALRELAGPGADYLIPFAWHRRSCLAMCTDELVYLTNLRTGPAGHFSYREQAWQMYQLALRREPALAYISRAQQFRPDSEIDIFQR